MKRILTTLAVIFSLCIAASSVAAQTNEQDQSVYIYSIVKFKNTLQNSTWKVSLTVDFGQADYKEADKVVDADGNHKLFNSNVAALNWLGMQGWEFVPYPTVNEGTSRSKYYMRLNVTGMTAEEINEKLNIFYNPKQSDATYVQNKDGLF